MTATVPLDTARGLVCLYCGELKAIALFSEDGGRRDGHRAECKACEEGMRLAALLDGQEGAPEANFPGAERRWRPKRSRLGGGVEERLRNRPKSGLSLSDDA